MSAAWDEAVRRTEALGAERAARLLIPPVVAPKPRAVAPTPMSPIARAIRLQIGELVARHNNEETEHERLAILAAEKALPAYWSRRGYSNQAAVLFTLVANRDGLPAALDRCLDRTHFAKTATALVDGLIPLNMAAADELRDAKVRAPWIDGGAELTEWFDLPNETREVA